jgi:hypothetical protein
MSVLDANYYLRRETLAKRLAEQAVHPNARISHELMANEYGRLVERSLRSAAVSL